MILKLDTFTSKANESIICLLIVGANKGLLIHNAFRQKHHAPPLIWNNELSERATKMAGEMATKGTLDVALVRSVSKYGENVARISGNFDVILRQIILNHLKA